MFSFVCPVEYYKRGEQSRLPIKCMFTNIVQSIELFKYLEAITRCREHENEKYILRE